MPKTSRERIEQIRSLYHQRLGTTFKNMADLLTALDEREELLNLTVKTLCRYPNAVDLLVAITGLLRGGKYEVK